MCFKHKNDFLWSSASDCKALACFAFSQSREVHSATHLPPSARQRVLSLRAPSKKRNPILFARTSWALDACVRDGFGFVQVRAQLNSLTASAQKSPSRYNLSVWIFLMRITKCENKCTARINSIFIIMDEDDVSDHCK